MYTGILYVYLFQISVGGVGDFGGFGMSQGSGTLEKPREFSILGSPGGFGSLREPPGASGSLLEPPEASGGFEKPREFSSSGLPEPSEGLRTPPKIDNLRKTT